MFGNRAEPTRIPCRRPSETVRTKEELKADRELAVFREFCVAKGMNVDAMAAHCQRPPKPDIVCTVDDLTTEFELVEITDESVASGVAESLRMGEITGGAFSQDEPLLYAFESKQRKAYETSAPPALLAYYDKQYPWSYADPTFIQDTVGHIAEAMIRSGIWSEIWVYDTWEHQILWTYPNAG